MENPKFKFEELSVYQKSLDFVDDVYSITKKVSKRGAIWFNITIQKSFSVYSFKYCRGCG
ncbi:hypothetical protein AEQU2_01277 [Aequorivita lipolytica]|nr:hypothetical protein AEQU2_01277 [Aequorivita lipolytica]